MKLSTLTKIITPYFKGSFALPEPKDKKNKLIHIVGVSSGIDSTATALALKILFPKTNFIYVFTDTGCEKAGTLETLSLLESFLGQSILRIKAAMPLMDHIEKNGGYIPSFRSRLCTSYSKIYPMIRFMKELKAKHGKNVEFAQYTGIRADEPLRKGANFSGDTSNNFPLQHLGLVKSDVNNIVNSTVGIPLYYQESSRSGCTTCYFGRVSEVIDAWATSPTQMERSAKLEIMPDNVVDVFNDLPISIAKETGISRNWFGFVRPNWLGYPFVGAQGERGKRNKKDTLDMFNEQSKTMFVAVEYQYHQGIPGMALPQVYFEKLITFSTTLGGLKIALKHFWLHRLQTKELHLQDSEEGMNINKQIAIIEVEIDDFETILPPKPAETFTWQSTKKPLIAIRKTVSILEHILLCEGLRQDGNKKVSRVSKEYGRVLNFSQYEKPPLFELIDDIDIEDAPVACNTCSR